MKRVTFPLQATLFQVDALNSTGNVTPINLVQTGNAPWNRIGAQVMYRRIRVRGGVWCTGLGAGVGEIHRILLVYDAQPNGTLPTYADILKDYDQQGNTITGPFSNYNPDYAWRFKILFDQLNNAPNNSNGASTDNTASMAHSSDDVIDWDIPCLLPTTYKSSTNPSVIGDIATGAIYVVTIGSQAAGANAYAACYRCSLDYIDQ